MRVNSFDVVPFVGSKENRGTAIPQCGISDRALSIRQAGRIAMTILSRRLKSAKKPSICFQGKYF